MKIGSFTFTRDSALWIWGIVVSIVGALATLNENFAVVTLGIPLIWLTKIRLASFVIGIVSAQLSTSPLKHSDASNTVSGPRPLPVILLAVALGAGALTLTSCAHQNPPVVAPVVTAAQKALDITRKVGVILEQVQIDELALYQAGKVPAATHEKIRKGLVETSSSVLTAIDTLSAASSATSAHDLVLAITNGLKTLAGDLGHLSGTEAARLAGVLDTAASLIEVALS